MKNIDKICCKGLYISSDSWEEKLQLMNLKFELDETSLMKALQCCLINQECNRCPAFSYGNDCAKKNI